MTQYTTPVPLAANEVGGFARALRAERGISLREAAAELAVSVSALSQAERNVASVYRLAIRAANHHLDRLTERDFYKAGRIEERIQAVGGAITALGRFRGPEVDRRAALLRQALLARRIPIERDGQFILIRLSEDALMVDLSNTTVFAWPGRPDATLEDTRGRAYAGSIVGTDDLVEGLSVEEWALAVDRFAEAVVSASAGGRLDLAALRSSDAEASQAATVSRRAPSSTTGRPMEQ